jgi:hypothetical protein
MSPKITFDFDEPIVVTLLYGQGLEIESKYYERWPGDTTQYVFNADEGVFFVPELAGALLNARLRSLGIAAGDTVIITKRKVRTPGSLRLAVEYFPELCVQPV